ncbi:putative bifunctional diguanylate cyclase/phosphodiesterase [Dongshaea marina]|uniref:putative bifunctional diguanylate cyclase/phosphodiesterase n=1 Tax=Dongshaea marina TaxID=2047966 RepID=UPI00131F134F|nr:GGDEF and EAL domain-containing protein [Dongshaea marina]
MDTLPAISSASQDSQSFWLIDTELQQMNDLGSSPLCVTEDLGFQSDLASWLNSLTPDEVSHWQQLNRTMRPGCWLMERSDLLFSLMWHPLSNHRWLVQIQSQSLEKAQQQQNGLACLLPEIPAQAPAAQQLIMAQYLIQYLNYFLGPDRLVLWQHQEQHELFHPIYQLGQLPSLGSMESKPRYLKGLHQRSLMTFSEPASQPLLKGFDYLDNPPLASRMDIEIGDSDTQLPQLFLTLDYLHKKNFDSSERTLAKEISNRLAPITHRLMTLDSLDTPPSRESTPELLTLLADKRGQLYFENLAILLNGLTGACRVVVSEYLELSEPPQLQSLAHAGHQELQPAFCITGTDHLLTLQQQQHWLLIEDGGELEFPGQLLEGSKAFTAYAGISLYTPHNQVIGLISLLFDEPIADPIALRNLLELASEHASSELYYFQQHRALQIGAAAFESLNAMIILDKEFIIQLSNKAWSRISGYPPRALLDKHFREIRPGFYGDIFYESVKESIEIHGYWQGEVQCTYQDGYLYPQFMTVTPIYDNELQLQSYICNMADISEQTKHQKQIEQLSTLDPLTGFYNRNALLATLHQKLEKSSAHGGLLLLDIDHFQSINNSLGHSAGDQLLQQLASRIREHSNEQILSARISSDLFALVIEEPSQQKLATRLKTKHHATELLSLLEKPFQLFESQIHVSATIGIALYPEQTQNPQELMQFADAALHHAKQGVHRGKFSYFEPNISQDTHQRMTLRSQLRQALLQEELELYFQPQFTVGERQLVGIEVLLRWFSKDNEAISPGYFIPIAEETNQICDISQWVLKKSAAQLAYWQHLGLHIPSMAINISTRHFHMPGFIKELQDVFADAEIDPKTVKLEITENVILEDHLEAQHKLSQLKELGFMLSIDDFGTGHSSLVYLKELPADEVKLDQAFIKTLLENPQDEVMVSAILSLGEAFGFEITAEGVETPEQLATLKKLGCHNFQGYLGSYPLPSRELEEFLQSYQPD